MATIDETLGQQIELDIESKEDEISRHGGIGISLEDFIQSGVTDGDELLKQAQYNEDRLEKELAKRVQYIIQNGAEFDITESMLDSFMINQLNIISDIDLLSTFDNDVFIKQIQDIDLLRTYDTRIDIEQDQTLSAEELTLQGAIELSLSDIEDEPDNAVIVNEDNIDTDIEEQVDSIINNDDRPHGEVTVTTTDLLDAEEIEVSTDEDTDIVINTDDREKLFIIAINDIAITYDENGDANPIDIIQNGKIFGSVVLLNGTEMEFRPSEQLQTMNIDDLEDVTFNYTVSDGTQSATSSITVNIAGIDDKTELTITPDDIGEEIVEDTIDENTIDAVPEDTVDEDTIDEIPEETISFVPEDTIPETTTEEVSEQTTVEIIDIPYTPESTIDEISESTIDESTTDEVQEQTIDENTIASTPEDTIESVQEQTIDEDTIDGVDEQTIDESTIDEIPENTTDEIPEQTIDEDTSAAVDEDTVPEETIDAIPESTIDGIAENTVDESTIDWIPENTVDEQTVDAVPESTIDEIPEDTVSEVPEDTIDAIPESTIDAIPENTIDEQTVDAIPENTIDENTIDFIPEQTIDEQTIEPYDNLDIKYDNLNMPGDSTGIFDLGHDVSNLSIDIKSYKVDFDDGEVVLYKDGEIVDIVNIDDIYSGSDNIQTLITINDGTVFDAFEVKHTGEAKGKGSSSQAFKIGGAIENDPENTIDENTIDAVPESTVDENTVDSVPEATVDENTIDAISESTIDAVDENTIDGVDEQTIDLIPENTIEEVPENTIDESTTDEIQENTIDENTIEEVPENTTDEVAESTVDEQVLIPAQDEDTIDESTIDFVPEETIEEVPENTIDENTIDAVDEGTTDEETIEEVPENTTEEIPENTIDEETIDSIPESTIDENTIDAIPESTIDEVSETTIPEDTIDAVPESTIDEDTTDAVEAVEITSKVPEQTVEEQTIDAVPEQTTDEQTIELKMHSVSEGDIVATFEAFDIDDEVTVDFTAGSNDEGFYEIDNNTVVLTSAGDTYVSQGGILPPISLTTNTGVSISTELTGSYADIIAQAPVLDIDISESFIDAEDDIFLYELDLSAGLTDTDGSEILSDITLKNIPEDSLISGDGITDNGDGTYNVTVDHNGDAKVTISSVSELSDDDLNQITATVSSTELNGEDVSTVSATSDQYLLDTDHLDLDFNNIDNDSLDDISSINISEGEHRIDNLEVEDVMNLTGEDNTLTIFGEDEDIVSLDTDTWTQGEDVEIDGQMFTSFTGGGDNGLEEVQLLISTHVQVDQS